MWNFFFVTESRRNENNTEDLIGVVFSGNCF